MQFQPDALGSYAPDDVTFLLRDLSHVNLELATEEREVSIQSGKRHYSEMLPIEFQPDEDYMALYNQILAQHAKKVASCVAIVAEKMAAYRGVNDLVLVSLARAGTPVGVLLKRYFHTFYGVNVPHYSVSIIRGRGIDETALRYILQHHPHAKVQFVDGWTGKGAITKELDQSITTWNQNEDIKLDAYLAVLADPGHCAHFYGTQEDFLIPSACLNSTVSGLVSRTVLNDAFLETGDFHGAKYYRELEPFDVSTSYIEAIVAHYSDDLIQEAKLAMKTTPVLVIPSWQGLDTIKEIQQQFDIQTINHIKPGVGETTRVLLRRVPWKILVNPHATQNLAHILLLAKKRGVAVESYEQMPYACCGLIKDLTR
ncbi:cysteine protease StiP family protein [Solibacillus sp. FSL H8-0523]|uniref:cysteine protease StiP family protein n=1 Tax=Solibacillus sp. FSL H8-0523 TaxID=2954511 RepID=UPI00310109C4